MDDPDSNDVKRFTAIADECVAEVLRILEREQLSHEERIDVADLVRDRMLSIERGNPRRAQ